MLKFDDTAAAEMFALERALATVLQRANELKVESAVAAFACIRCARVLLNLYPDATRTVLVDQTVIPFLKNEPAGNNAGALIIRPGGML